MPKLLVILAHPRGEASFCGALARSYRRGAADSGADVSEIDLSCLDFDPNVTMADPRSQPLERDLTRLRQLIEAADHLVFVYPTWWGTAPALLKGALDRVLLPGWAFRTTTGGTGYEGLLIGRSAELITTMDTPGPVYHLFYGAPGHRAMARATLGFCGIRTVRKTRFGPMRHSSENARGRWLERTYVLGRTGATGDMPVAGRAVAGIAAWLQALRLQFYPMTFLAYWLGALTVGTPISATTFWLGYLMLFLLEAATVFTNDVFDEASDRGNACYGPFTGGSRVLQKGLIARDELILGAAVALAASAAMLAVLSGLSSQPLTVLGFFAGFGVLALGYTVPPMKLSHRGLGELVVALTHSFGAIYAGRLLQGGGLDGDLPLVLGAPLFLAVLGAIALAGVPDAAADGAADKRTLTVQFGAPAMLWLALACTFGAFGAAVAFAVAGWSVWSGIAYGAPLHALALGLTLCQRLKRTGPYERIDGLMALSLAYIMWFVVVPLLHLA